MYNSVLYTLAMRVVLPLWSHPDRVHAHKGSLAARGEGKGGRFEASQGTTFKVNDGFAGVALEHVGTQLHLQIILLPQSGSQRTTNHVVSQRHDEIDGLTHAGRARRL